MKNTGGKEVTRRNFLSVSTKIAGCSALALGLGSCGIGSLLYSSGDIPVVNGPAEIDLKTEPALAAPGGAVKKRFVSMNDGEVIIVVRTNMGKFSAFAAQCTHWGAEVDPPKNGVMVCPFHGSRFSDENGEVLEGPAGSPLKLFRVDWDRQQQKLILSPEQ